MEVFKKWKKKLRKIIYNKDFLTNLRITEIQSVAGLDQLQNLKKIQIYRDKIAKNYFNLISKYQSYFTYYIHLKELNQFGIDFTFFKKYYTIKKFVIGLLKIWKRKFECQVLVLKYT